MYVLNILNLLYTLRFFSSKCSLFHNANLFGSCIIHILYTGCAKIKKKKSGAKRLITLRVLIPFKGAPSGLVTWAHGGLFSSYTCFGLATAEGPVSGVWEQRPSVHHGPIQASFIVDKITLGKVFFPSSLTFPNYRHSTSVLYPFFHYP